MKQRNSLTIKLFISKKISIKYIVKKHNIGWYIGLAIITIAFSVLAVFLQGWTFLALIIVSAITILIFTSRPPRKIHYELSSKGLTEEKTFHPYSEFRAFGILKEDSHYSAVLIPKKRFSLHRWSTRSSLTNGRNQTRLSRQNCKFLAHLKKLC